MNFEYSMLSERPNWKYWRNLGSVKLEQAILLSLDICPIWYKDVIIYYRQMSCFEDYFRNLDENESQIRVDVFKYVEPKLTYRLHIVKSWAFKQDWVLDSKVFIPNEINEDTLVDLKRFFQAAFNQMGFENDYDKIPSDLYLIKKEDDIEIQLLPKNKWVLKAQEFAENYCKENPEIKLNLLAERIYERFITEKIQSSHGGGTEISVSTIKTEALSKSQWFSNYKRTSNK